MRKEDIEDAARILSEIKDSLNELDSSLKMNNISRVNAIKAKVISLQHKMRELI